MEMGRSLSEQMFPISVSLAAVLKIGWKLGKSLSVEVRTSVIVNKMIGV